MLDSSFTKIIHIIARGDLPSSALQATKITTGAVSKGTNKAAEAAHWCARTVPKIPHVTDVDREVITVGNTLRWQPLALGALQLMRGHVTCLTLQWTYLT